MRRKFCGRKVESQVAALGQTNIDGVRAQHCNAVTKQHCNNVTWYGEVSKTPVTEQKRLGGVPPFPLTFSP